MEFEEERTDGNPPDSSYKSSPDEVKMCEKREDEPGQNVCQHFLLGRCHFGDRCRLSHSIFDVPQFTLSNKEDAPSIEQQDEIDKNGHAEMPHKKTEKQECKKKPRMRTADEVISRIKWDSSVDPADFIVGHLDRFLGVLERPFSDFSWDTQVCDCDFSEELALPRHRIQYFSYKGQRVWDRDSRTDRVFGSTGHTIVPPFRNKGQQPDNYRPDTGEVVESTGKDNASIGHDQSSELSEKQDDNKATNVKQKCEDTIIHSCTKSTEEETRGLILQTESPAERLLEHQSLAQKLESEEDSWDGVGTSDPELAFHSPQLPSKRPPPSRPTHFICFRVDSPAALQAVLRIKRKVLSHLPLSEPLWLNPATLHVTLSLLVLSGPQEVSAAADLLQATVCSSFKPPISVSFTPKLKQFNGTVLHVVPQPLSDVQSLNSPLQEAFKERGWLHRHSRCPSYHLTLAKGKVPTARKMFEGIGVVKLGKDVNFGKLEVNKLYLCIIGQRNTETGFNQVVCSVDLPSV